jgi:hypothetical protein
MKKIKFVFTVFSLSAALLLAGACDNPFFEKPHSPDTGFQGGGGGSPEEGEGALRVSLSGGGVNVSLARTMLPLRPEFTRYELDFGNVSYDGGSTWAASGMEPYSFYNNAAQLNLPAGSYVITAKGYNGDVLTAQSAEQTVNVTAGSLASLEFELSPYINPAERGTLTYSLSWDSLSRMPYRAELLIETYPAGTPIALASIPSELTAGSAPGTIVLLRKDTAMVNLTGSLSLDPGEYRLTMSVIMDEGAQPVSRMDLAHVYSNLVTPGAFHYGGGDLISSAGVDPGAAFITRFTFAEYPNATSVVGGVAGADGTRMIMVMLPSPAAAELNNLTPIVECAEGARITSPTPLMPGEAGYAKGEIDFTNPTIWTARSGNGATQRYTVVVSTEPIGGPLEKKITYFFFQEFPNNPAVINEPVHTIAVTAPYGASTTYPNLHLTPVISIIGKRVVRWDGTADQPVSAYDFNAVRTYRVYNADESGSQDYTVTVTEALNTERQITRFAIDGYPEDVYTDDKYPVDTIPDVTGVINEVEGTITATLPYGVSLANLKPLIEYRGESLDPGSGVVRNFSVPVNYTVRAGDGNTKTYSVTLSNAPANSNKGIFDFVITNYANCKVVIGQNPRPDGKIPIVIQVPFATDEENLIPAVTLSDPTAQIDRIMSGTPASPASGVPIPFNTDGDGNNQEATYRVTAQDGSYQDYVAVVSKGGEYYYVNGVTGRDDYPDYYDGQSEAYPFKTLAYAVRKAAETSSSITRIIVNGELNGTNQTGSHTDPGLNTDPNSVIAINGTGGKKITVTGMNGAVLKGTANKRVLSVTNNSELVFENITVTEGNTTGNGGGIYIKNSKVKFSAGIINRNSAGSGGGVFVDTEGTGESDFTLMDGSINNNNATGSSTGANPSTGAWTSTPPSIAGGGGVCISGNSVFWLSGGTVSNNTTAGSGGGVLVRATAANFLTPSNPESGPANDNAGFLMGGGTVSGNTSNGSVSPHGGGGVYVASGEFDMIGGDITGNNSLRQGGGVFVHSGAIFIAWGNSTITGNNGVGSSKAICSRGYTLLRGRAQADKVYVWNPLAEDAVNIGGVIHDRFIMSEGARITGMVLAYSAEGRNFIDISNITGTDQISVIDLEGHLTNYKFVDTDINDWLNRKILTGANPALNSLISNNRFLLGAFVGRDTLSLSRYQLALDNPSLSTEAKLKRRP